MIPVDSCLITAPAYVSRHRSVCGRPGFGQRRFGLQHRTELCDQLIYLGLAQFKRTSFKCKTRRPQMLRLKIGLAYVAPQGLPDIHRRADENLAIEVEEPIDAGSYRRRGEDRFSGETVAATIRLPR